VTGNDNNRDDVGRREREDAAWRAIIDHYGEHPEFTPPTEAEPEPAPEAEPEPRPGPEPPAHLFAFETPPELGPRSWEPAPEDDRYVPPPAPPLPRPQGLRLVAWLGLFGVPAIVLVCIVLHVSLPSPLGFLALVWFVGGFGYLVATMNGPKDPDGGSDDGAVV
jgi:hypothetical protein